VVRRPDSHRGRDVVRWGYRLGGVLGGLGFLGAPAKFQALGLVAPAGVILTAVAIYARRHKSGRQALREAVWSLFPGWQAARGNRRPHFEANFLLLVGLGWAVLGLLALS